ncbi:MULTISPECIES: ABC transporter permease subunit [Nocardioides]|uniref:ABC transporter permease subunit n=1 Tax=Nocardioides TaxID=1839 RepID=UPI000CE46B2B|nr:MULTISPECIES: ABC transporter permease subunit [Nocardioides]
MNRVVARLTARTLLGRRRALLLVLLPGVLLALCVFARVFASLDDDASARAGIVEGVVAGFGMAVLLPLLGLITGTGAIGSEIDDGSIVYLLSKPLSRFTIILTKLAVAVAVVTVLGALPVLVGAVVVTGELGRVALAFGVGSLAGGVAYCALFLMLSVVTRNAVVLGLVYALVWESLVGQIVPGAQSLSILQWALAVTESVLGDEATRLGIESAVDLSTAVVLLLVVVVGGTWYATRRLRTIRLGE